MKKIIKYTKIEEDRIRLEESDILDLRLSKEAMDHLWDDINGSKQTDARKTLAGNISKSVYIQDKDNWFYENVKIGLIIIMFMLLIKRIGWCCII